MEKVLTYSLQATQTLCIKDRNKCFCKETCVYIAMTIAITVQYRMF